MRNIKLGLNIDHVATIRNARGGDFPNPMNAALLAEKSGVDNITLHLREDRRHIKDEDLYIIKENINIPMNLEMASTEEMLKIALKILPEWVCIVPERREEITTEGGLSVIKNFKNLENNIKMLKDNDIKVSLFVDPINDEILASSKLNVDAVELHTGQYCLKRNNYELNRIVQASKFASSNMLEVHAGHGLNYETAQKIAKVKEITELNIGHFIISESIFYGLENVINKMKKIINSD